MAKRQNVVQRKIKETSVLPDKKKGGCVKISFILLSLFATNCASKFSWMPRKISQTVHRGAEVAKSGKSRSPASIRIQQKALMSKVLSKYRAVLDNYDWEIRKSDATGGFLEATRPETSDDESKKLILNLSCYNTTKKDVTCSVRLRKCEIRPKTVHKGCSYMKNPTNDNIKKFLKALKSI